MDETPIKAGLSSPGKMKAAYIWPVYGEQDEICFLYYPSRSGKHVQDALGLAPPVGSVLQSDGYEVYAQYAKKTGRRMPSVGRIRDARFMRRKISSHPTPSGHWR